MLIVQIALWSRRWKKEFCLRFWNPFSLREVSRLVGFNVLTLKVTRRSWWRRRRTRWNSKCTMADSWHWRYFYRWDWKGRIMHDNFESADWLTIVLIVRSVLTLCMVLLVRPWVNCRMQRMNWTEWNEIEWIESNRIVLNELNGTELNYRITSQCWSFLDVWRYPPLWRAMAATWLLWPRTYGFPDCSD